MDVRSAIGKPASLGKDELGSIPSRTKLYPQV
jgi:hypothetical protein